MRIFTWLCFCLLACSAPAMQLSINFADQAEGSAPTNFHAELAGQGMAPQWKIMSAQVPSLFSVLSTNAAPNTKVNLNERRVLVQTAMDMTDEHFPMLIYDGDIYRDFKATVRFETVSGITEQMAGLVFHFQNSSNFYVARVSSLGHNIRFYKVINGDRPALFGNDIPVPTGMWHTLGVQCEGNQINIFLDGKQAMQTLNDSGTMFKDGKIGFWTKSDSVTYFSDLTVDYTPRIAAAQTMVDSIMQQEPRILGLRIYTLQAENNTNYTRVIASKMTNEVGVVGTVAEMNAITNGVIFFGTERGAVYVTMPLRDRNGEYIAAMRVKLKSYITESRDAAVMRATMIRNRLEANYTTMDELLGR